MFHPFDQLAARLLKGSVDDEDGAHDLSHIVRDWRNAKRSIRKRAAHRSCWRRPSLRMTAFRWQRILLWSQASLLAAKEARTRLKHWVGAIAHRDRYRRNREFSCSAGIAPTSIEGCILQDADRLDAIGVSGIARCFYTAGRLGSRLYDLADPEGKTRPLDDARYALDHFPKKLLTLEGSFKTRKGQELAKERHRRLDEFYRAMLSEVQE